MKIMKMITSTMVIYIISNATQKFSHLLNAINHHSHNTWLHTPFGISSRLLDTYTRHWRKRVTWLNGQHYSRLAKGWPRPKVTILVRAYRLSTASIFTLNALSTLTSILQKFLPWRQCVLQKDMCKKFGDLLPHFFAPNAICTTTRTLQKIWWHTVSFFAQHAICATTSILQKNWRSSASFFCPKCNA